MLACFSASGRARGARLLVCYAVLAAVVWLCLALPYDRLAVALGIGAAVALGLAKAAVESGRRLQDLGISARAGAWAALAAGAAALCCFYFSLQDDRAMLPVTGLVGVALVALIVWPGDANSNRFGDPPPSALAATEAPAGGRAALLVPFLALLIIEGGILSLAWLNDGLRRAHERQNELSRHPQPVEQDNIFAATPENGR